jgi:hypothetical protein
VLACLLVVFVLVLQKRKQNDPQKRAKNGTQIGNFAREDCTDVTTTTL